MLTDLAMEKSYREPSFAIVSFPSSPVTEPGQQHGIQPPREHPARVKREEGEPSRGSRRTPGRALAALGPSPCLLDFIIKYAHIDLLVLMLLLYIEAFATH